MQGYLYLELLWSRYGAEPFLTSFRGDFILRFRPFPEPYEPSSAISFLISSRRAGHERASFAVSLSLGHGGLSAAGADYGIGYDLCAFADASGDFGHDAVRDAHADRMGGERVAFPGPHFMFALAILDHGILPDQREGRREAQCLCGDAQYSLLVQRIDGDVRRQPWFQFQVGVVGGDDYLVSHYRRAGGGTA